MPTPTTYTYSIANDCLNGMVNTDKLAIAIRNSTISIQLDSIGTTGDNLLITFVDVISGTEQTTLTGLVHTTDSMPWGSAFMGVIGSRKGLDMNTTSDQDIFMNATKYIIRRIVAYNAVGVMSTPRGGIYASPSKGGTTIVGATQSYSVLTNDKKFVDLTLSSSTTSTVFTDDLIYLSLSTPKGSAGTIDIVIFGDDLSNA